MPAPSVTVEEMTAAHPDLFRVSTPKPRATFAEQYAAASAVVALHTARQPMPPAVCLQLAARMAAGKAS